MNWAIKNTPPKNGRPAVVLDNDTVEIQGKGASQRGENNPARGDAEKTRCSMRWVEEAK
jgi:hypothetical protein